MDEATAGTAVIQLISNLRKAIEEKRKEWVGPVNTYLKSINADFKGLSEPLDEADKVIRGKVLAYRHEVERKAREVEEINRMRLEAVRKEAALNDGAISQSVDILPAAPLPPAHVRTDLGTLGTMRVRKYRVVDFGKLPDQYKMENTALLTKMVKAGIPEIPGVEIWEDETLTVRPRG